MQVASLEPGWAPAAAWVSSVGAALQPGAFRHLTQSGGAEELRGRDTARCCGLGRRAVSLSHRDHPGSDGAPQIVAGQIVEAEVNAAVKARIHGLRPHLTQVERFLGEDV